MLKRKPKLKENKPKTNKSQIVAIIGTIILLTGGFLVSFNYIQTKKMYAYDYMTNVFYDAEKNTEEPQEDTSDNNTSTQTAIEQLDNTTYEYIGYLEIPKIDLRKGFLPIDAKDNDVEKNILVVSGSSYPDKDKGNLIIAGHSGTGYKAFFNDLYKLSNGDTANVIFNDHTYIYKINNIYTQPKTGKIAIYRNYDKTTLTLITCTNDDITTQTVYIAELSEIK